MATIWGIDSAQTAGKELFDCVVKNYGKPLFWGRYLSRVEGAAEGLSRDEILFLHTNGVRIMPIYSGFRSSVGANNGIIAAQNAIFNAKKLRIPFGKVIFANVERFFDVNDAWIEGWFNTIQKSGYRVGYYHDPVTGGFNEAFCKAVERNKHISVQSILWSAEPETGVTKKKESPSFRALTVNCESNTWGWQYGRDADTCSIDTNLINDKLYQFLY